MKKSLRNSLSWSFLFASALALGAPSCTPEERNFGNSGGGGSGAGGVCVPDTEESCYSGPPDTLEVGVCRTGIHICLPSGNGFGECGGDVVPTPENCLTPEDEACNGTDPMECPTLANGWVKFFGSLGFGQTILDVAVTDTGDIVAVGSFADTIDFGLGPMASTGALDIFVAKFDPMGNALWAKRFGDSAAQVATAVAVDNTGAIYVGGAMAGSVDFEGTKLTSAGASDVFLARFEADGTVAWANQYGDAMVQTVSRIAVTKTNNIIVAGEYAGSISFDASGGNKHTSKGKSDVFVARFDTSGFVAGSNSFGGLANETVHGMALDSKDAIYLTGGFEDTVDFGMQTFISGGRDGYVTMLGPTLAPTNAFQFGFANGPTSFQEGYDVAIGPNDEVFVSGAFADALEFPGMFLSNMEPTSRSLFLAHFTSQLMTPVSAAQFGGVAGTVNDARLAVDSVAKQLVIAGSFTGDMSFGGDLLHAEGALDPFMAKLGFDDSFIAARSLPNDMAVADGANNINALAILPGGDLIIGGAQRAPIVFDQVTYGEVDTKDGNAILGRFLH